MRDWFKKFAILPTQMSNGAWVWLKTYYTFEEFSWLGYSQVMRKQLKKPQGTVSSINDLVESFGISYSMLAGLLGVTQKTLLSWETDTPISPAKKERLKNLLLAINYLVQIKPEYGSRKIFSLLSNGRILIDRQAARDYEKDPELDYDGTVSLISYLNYKDDFPITITEAISEAINDFERLV